MAGLKLRRSLRRDLLVIPAPSHFGESDLRYRSCRLRRGKWRPAEVNLLYLACPQWLGHVDRRYWSHSSL